MDIVDRPTRSRMMAGVRSKDTKPEIVVRRLAHGLGYRFRLHRRDLPGTPDLVFPRYRTVVQVNGCFWHGHAGCKRSARPSTNAAFWSEKIEGNRTRDLRSAEALAGLGWAVVTIWECEIADREALADRLRQAMQPTARAASVSPA